MISDLSWYTIVPGVAGAILAVVLPTSIVAFLMLRRRNLSAILEGSGWAINSRMRLTHDQGRFFTRRPEYPSGAKGIRRTRWQLVAFALLLVAGLVSAWLVSELRRQAADADADGSTSQVNHTANHQGNSQE